MLIGEGKRFPVLYFIPDRTKTAADLEFHKHKIILGNKQKIEAM